MINSCSHLYMKFLSQLASSQQINSLITPCLLQFLNVAGILKYIKNAMRMEYVLTLLYRDWVLGNIYFSLAFKFAMHICKMLIKHREFHLKVDRNVCVGHCN